MFILCPFFSLYIQQDKLESILQRRLCLSETNLHYRNSNSSSNSSNVFISVDVPKSSSKQSLTIINELADNNNKQQQQAPQKISLAPEPNLQLLPNISANNHYQPNYMPSSSALPQAAKLPFWSSIENGVQQSTSKQLFSSLNNASGSVATKIQRVKNNVKNHHSQYQQHQSVVNNNNLPIFGSARWKSYNMSPEINKRASGLGHLMSSSTQELTAREQCSPRESQYFQYADNISGNIITTFLFFIYLFYLSLILSLTANNKKNCKLKRSVSNFDASVYYKNRDTYYGAWGFGEEIQTINGTIVDNPWKLRRPKNNENVNLAGGIGGITSDWSSQYLSFEFLNERIKSRLQAEVGSHHQLSFATIDDDFKQDTGTSEHHNGQQQIDSAYQTAQSENSGKHLMVNGYLNGSNKKNNRRSLINTKLSCSEANLSSINNNHSNNLKSQKCSKVESNRLGKRKSFKKLIEQYFVSSQPNTDLNHSSSQESLVSSNAYSQPSALAQFDQNFILKRSTPNAGLTEHEQLFTQSNLKGIYYKTECVTNIKI